MIELVLFLALGIIAGSITGLIPGIHINLIGALIISLSATILTFTSPIFLLIFLVSMAITHTFIDFIPSILLGAPDEDTILSILPGHELLKQGQAYQAIIYTLYGSFAAVIVLLLITPIILYLLSRFENIIATATPLLLIISTIFLISKEKFKLRAVIVFILAGFLGIAALNSNINQPFLPMLSGLFGVSSLIISIKNKTIVPEQIISNPKIRLKNIFPPVLAASLASPFCCLLPGFGSGQAAVISSNLIKSTKKDFLIMLGTINTLIIGLSFIVYYSIQKTRTGIALTTSELFSQITTRQLIIILTAALLTSVLCFYWTKTLAKVFSKNINKLNYPLLSIIIIVIITALTICFSGVLGAVILIVSTNIGIFGILSDVKRINLMGCLVIPVVLIYLI